MIVDTDNPTHGQLPAWPATHKAFPPEAPAAILIWSRPDIVLAQQSMLRNINAHLFIYTVTVFPEEWAEWN